MVPARLYALGLAYTGAGTSAWLDTLSKVATKLKLAHAGLPTPAWSEDGTGLDPEARVIVKAVWEHGSLGIDEASVMPAGDAPRAIAENARRWNTEFFAEAYIEGREFAAAMLGGPNGVEVLPLRETVFQGFGDGEPLITGYDAKWTPGTGPYLGTPRRFGVEQEEPQLAAELRRLALSCWRLFGVHGYARADFRVDGSGAPFILEVNMNPSLGPDAGFAASGGAAGISYGELVGLIVAEAAGLGVSAPSSNTGVAANGNGLDWRTEVVPGDVERVRALVASTGMFTEAEIDIAGELVTERLAKGQRSGYRFIFAERGDWLLAYACYGPIAGTEDSFDLYWIAVAPGEQGRGLGGAVHARAEAAMREEGASHVYAETSASDRYAPTRAFYLHMGFAEQAQLPDFYAPGDGKVIYAKTLA
jgi:D-alanine-D-alanine ligase